MGLFGGGLMPRVLFPLLPELLARCWSICFPSFRAIATDCCACTAAFRCASVAATSPAFCFAPVSASARRLCSPSVVVGGYRSDSDRLLAASFARGHVRAVTPN